MKSDFKRYLTPKQMAEAVGASVYTVLAWARQGRIPAVRMSRKLVRFDPDEVFAALEGANHDKRNTKAD